MGYEKSRRNHARCRKDTLYAYKLDKFGHEDRGFKSQKQRLYVYTLDNLGDEDSGFKLQKKTLYTDKKYDIFRNENSKCINKHFRD